MKLVNTEGVEFLYDFNFSYPLCDFEFLISNDALDYVDKSDLHLVCRAIITENKVRNFRHLEYLYWFGENSLKDIDGRVMLDEYTDDDFINSIKTYFAKDVVCFGCNHVYKGALAVEGSVVYWGQWDLADKKIVKLRNKNRVIKKCLHCDKDFTLTVVHLFD